MNSKRIFRHIAVPVTLATTLSLVAGPAMAASAPSVARAQASASDDSPDSPLPVPLEGAVSIGQSAQLRVNADGTPNGQLVDYRWSVTQVTVQGDVIPESLNIPEQGQGLRSLLNFENPPQDAETGTADMAITKSENGTFGEARTVSLLPADFEVPVSLSTKFTLDGEEVTPEEIVGADGVVTAQYTIKNLSTTKMDVPITAVGGEEKVITVDNAMTPLVVQAEAFIPQRFTGLNTGTGQGGADGRGNTQVAWISLPFAPVNPKGEATFGWAANVTDGLVPSMVVQVLPLYIPAGEDGEAAAEDGGRGALFPPIGGLDISNEVAGVRAGVTQVLAGLRGFGGGQDPLTVLERRLNAFFEGLGLRLTGISRALEGLPRQLQQNVDRLGQAQDQLDRLNNRLTQLQRLLTSDQITFIVNNWPQVQALITRLDKLLPTVIQFLEGNLDLPIDCTQPDPEGPPATPDEIPVGQVNERILKALVARKYPDAANGYIGFRPRFADLPPRAQNQVGDAYTYGPDTRVTQVLNINTNGTVNGGAIWTGTGWDVVENLVPVPPEFAQIPGIPSEVGINGTIPVSRTTCNLVIDQAGTIIPALIAAELGTTVEDLVARLNSVYAIINNLAGRPAFDPDNQAAQAELARALGRLSGLLTAVIPLTNVLGRTLGQVETGLTRLQTRIVDLNDSLASAGQAVGQTNVTLPELSQVIDAIVKSVLASPQGQQITGGLGQVSSSLGGIGNELGTFVAGLVASLQTGAAAIRPKVGQAKASAQAAVQRVNLLKAEIGAMLLMANKSPLVYGGDPKDAPPNTVLAGAYEFRIDPANTEEPATVPRILLGLVALIIAGIIGRVVAKRRKKGPEDSGDGGDGDSDGGDDEEKAELSDLVTKEE